MVSQQIYADLAKKYAIRWYTIFFIIGFSFLGVNFNDIGFSFFEIWWILYILFFMWVPFLYALYRSIAKWMDEGVTGWRLYGKFLGALVSIYVIVGILFPPLVGGSAGIPGFVIAGFGLPIYIILSLLFFTISIRHLSNSHVNTNHKESKRNFIILVSFIVFLVSFFTFYNSIFYYIAITTNNTKLCPTHYSDFVEPLGVAPKKTGYIQSMCYEKIAFQTKDENICRLTESKHICYREIRILKDDIRVCDSLSGYFYLYCINDSVGEGTHLGGKSIYKINQMCKEEKKCLYDFYVAETSDGIIAEDRTQLNDNSLIKTEKNNSKNTEINDLIDEEDKIELNNKSITSNKSLDMLSLRLRELKDQKQINDEGRTQLNDNSLIQTEKYTFKNIEIDDLIDKEDKTEFNKQAITNHNNLHMLSLRLKELKDQMQKGDATINKKEVEMWMQILINDIAFTNSQYLNKDMSINMAEIRTYNISILPSEKNISKRIHKDYIKRYNDTIKNIENIKSEELSQQEVGQFIFTFNELVKKRIEHSEVFFLTLMHKYYPDNKYSIHEKIRFTDSFVNSKNLKLVKYSIEYYEDATSVYTDKNDQKMINEFVVKLKDAITNQ